MQGIIYNTWYLLQYLSSILVTTQDETTTHQNKVPEFTEVLIILSYGGKFDRIERILCLFIFDN